MGKAVRLRPRSTKPKAGIWKSYTCWCEQRLSPAPAALEGKRRQTMVVTATSTIGEQGAKSMSGTKKKKQLAAIEKSLDTAALQASEIEEANRHRWATHWGGYLAHYNKIAAQVVASMEDPISALAKSVERTRTSASRPRYKAIQTMSKCGLCAQLGNP